MFNGLIATAEGGRGIGTINFAEYNRLSRMLEHGELPNVKEVELRIGLLRHMRQENIGTAADKKDMQGLPEFIDDYIGKHARILENAGHLQEHERQAYLREHGLTLPKKSKAGALAKKLSAQQKIDKTLTITQNALSRGSAMLELAQLCTSPSMTAMAASLGAVCASELAGQATEIILEAMETRADTPEGKTACLEGLDITTELHNKDQHKKEMKDLGRREIEKPSGSDDIAVRLAELNPQSDAERLDDALKLRDDVVDKATSVAEKPEKEQVALAFKDNGDSITKDLAKAALCNLEQNARPPTIPDAHAKNPYFIQTPQLNLKYKKAQSVIQRETDS